MGKKQAPAPIENIEITCEILAEVEGVYWTSPDGSSIQAQALAYEWVKKDEYSGRYLRVVLPQLSYWSMVYIKLI